MSAFPWIGILQVLGGLFLTFLVAAFITGAVVEYIVIETRGKGLSSPRIFTKNDVLLIDTRDRDSLKQWVYDCIKTNVNSAIAVGWKGSIGWGVSLVSDPKTTNFSHFKLVIWEIDDETTKTVERVPFFLRVLTHADLKKYPKNLIQATGFIKI